MAVSPEDLVAPPLNRPPVGVVQSEEHWLTEDLTLAKDQPELRSWSMTIASLVASLGFVVAGALGQEPLGVALPPSRSRDPEGPDAAFRSGLRSARSSSGCGRQSPFPVGRALRLLAEVKPVDRSRSRIRNSAAIGAAATAARGLLAAHAVVGFQVTPIERIRLRPSSITTNPVRQRNVAVGIWKKSQATIPLAYTGMNSAHSADGGLVRLTMCLSIVDLATW